MLSPSINKVLIYSLTYLEHQHCSINPILHCLEKQKSEYDQEIPRSQTADKPMAPGGRATQQSQDTRKTN